MVHTGVARPYSACRSGSGLNEGLGRTLAGASVFLAPARRRRRNLAEALGTWKLAVFGCVRCATAFPARVGLGLGLLLATVQVGRAALFCSGTRTLGGVGSAGLRCEAHEPLEALLQSVKWNVRLDPEPSLNASWTWINPEAMSGLPGIRTCGLTFELSCPRRQVL
jgi:hypothetical protein